MRILLALILQFAVSAQAYLSNTIDELVAHNIVQPGKSIIFDIYAVRSVTLPDGSSAQATWYTRSTNSVPSLIDEKEARVLKIEEAGAIVEFLNGTFEYQGAGPDIKKHFTDYKIARETACGKIASDTVVFGIAINGATVAGYNFDCRDGISVLANRVVSILKSAMSDKQRMTLGAAILAHPAKQE